MAVDEVLYRRVTTGDPGLLAALAAGDAATHAEVARLLRVTRLETLRHHARALVAVLEACPELDAGVRHAWRRQDPGFTAQLLSWVAQRRAVAA